MFFKTRIAIVGGFVRDMFLGIPSADIDLVVEQSLNNILKKMGHIFPVDQMVVHREFGTATLHLKDGSSLDITTARKELYPFPGALPEVIFPATLEEDLGRRDFTVNAMALEITFGTPKIIDPHGGRADIQNKILRVLHPLSFRDDPTRILRGIRLASRLNFKFEEETEKLLKKAISERCFSNISKERFLNEFFLILQEKNFFHSLELLNRYGILKILDPNFTLYTEDKKNLKKIDTHWGVAKGLNLDRKTLLILALLEGSSLSKRKQTLENMNFSKKNISALLWSTQEQIKILRCLRNADKNSEIFKILSPCNPYLLFFLLLKGDKISRKKIEKHLFYLRKLPVIIDGKTLVDLGLKPDNNFKNILKEAYYIQLDMKKPSRAKILKELNLHG